MPLDAVQPLIAQTLATQPDALRGVTLKVENGQAIPRLEWKVRDPRADDHDDRDTHFYAATLAADGSVQVREEHPSQLVEFIDVLHRVVGLPADIDPYRWVMGVVAALYFVALVSGVIVLLPSLVKDFFALRVGKNLKRMWLDAHNVVGIVSLPFHIVMALSAVVFAYHDQIYAVQDRMIHQGQWAQPPAAPQGKPGNAPARNPADMLLPSQLVQMVRQTAPGFEPNSLQYTQVTGPRPMVRVWGKDPQAVSPRAVGGFAALDPYSGKLLSTDYLSGQQSTPNLFISSFFALHMASFGGTAETLAVFSCWDWPAPGCSTAATCCGSKPGARPAQRRRKAHPAARYRHHGGGHRGRLPGLRGRTLADACRRQMAARQGGRSGGLARRHLLQRLPGQRGLGLLAWRSAGRSAPGMAGSGLHPGDSALRPCGLAPARFRCLGRQRHAGRGCNGFGR